MFSVMSMLFFDRFVFAECRLYTVFYQIFWVKSFLFGTTSQLDLEKVWQVEFFTVSGFSLALFWAGIGTHNLGYFWICRY